MTSFNAEDQRPIRFIRNWISRNKCPKKLGPPSTRNSLVEEFGIDVDMDRLQAERDAAFQMDHLAPSVKKFWQVFFFKV